MDCPICDFKDLPQGVEVCPQCDSDIKSFILLDSIESGTTITSVPQKQFNKWYLLLLLVLVFPSWYMFSSDSSEIVIANLKDSNSKLILEVERVNIDLDETQESNYAIKAELEDIKNLQTYQWVTVSVREGDNLDLILKRLPSELDFDKRLELICEKNNIKNPDLINVTDKIKIVL